MQSYLTALQLPTDQRTLDAFETFYQMLVECNGRFNLTSVTDRSEVCALHFADSLLPHSLIPTGARVIDVGTGAGFPGLPLAIVRPDLQLRLVDSTLKKVNFVRDVASALGLTNVQVLHARAEELATADCDIALARAVAPLDKLVGFLLPPLRPGGRIIAYKSRHVDAELAQAQRTLARKRCQLVDVISMTLPIRDIERRIVILAKS